MDQVRANVLAKKVLGKTFCGWSLSRLIDHGKSAAVFEARKGHEIAAFKVFDPEIVERFGAAVQKRRIDRERELIGETHQNLVQIFDGGEDKETGLFFVVMEYLPQENLSKRIDRIDPSTIPIIVRQLASAAKYLESKGLVHRDIKPSNIIWDEAGQHLKLLDLGVLGPIGNIGSLTDTQGRQFIGTLQYSSPEYLLRTENDTEDGWRAITFYQIGAVMHDLIMRKPIFSEFVDPFGRLVNAVQHEQPLIKSSVVSGVIADLARACLVKNPDIRLNLVSWASFEALDREQRVSAKERVTNRLILSAAESGAVSEVSVERQRTALAADIASTLRRFINTVRSDSSVFPPVTVTRDLASESMVIRFRPSERHRLPLGLAIILSWKVLDPGEKVIEVSGRIDSNEDSPYEIVFFKGVMDYQNLYAGLEDLIYTLLDKVQTK